MNENVYIKVHLNPTLDRLHPPFSKSEPLGQSAEPRYGRIHICHLAFKCLTEPEAKATDAALNATNLIKLLYSNYSNYEGLHLRLIMDYFYLRTASVRTLSSASTFLFCDFRFQFSFSPNARSCFNVCKEKQTSI